MNLKAKILEFLYEQVSTNKIPHLKRGMAEDLEAFIMKILAEQQAVTVANKMAASVQEDVNEDNC